MTVEGEVLGETATVGNHEELASAIDHAIGAEDRTAVGQRLRDNVREEYDWGGIAAATEATYNDVLRSHAEGSRRRRRFVREAVSRR